MPRTAAANQKIREAARRTIIESGMALFAENGYAHTSTRQIATHAGISTGLMYHYFSSKEALLRAVVEHGIELINIALGEVIMRIPPPQRLPKVIEAIFALLAARRDFWTLFYSLRGQPAIDTLLGEDFRLWTANLRDLFVADFTLNGRSHPTRDAFLLYSLIEGTIQQYLLQPDSYPLDDMVEAIRAFTLGPKGQF